MRSLSSTSRLQKLKLLAALLGIPVIGFAKPLIDENFDALPSGPIAAGRYDSIVPWEGPSEREYGWIAIEDKLPGGPGEGHGKTIALHDSTSAPNKSPSLQFNWGTSPSTTGKIRLAWDFLVPFDDPEPGVQSDSYMAVQFIGNNWDDAAVIVILSDGRIHVQYDKGEASRIEIGTYSPGRWRAVRIDLDPAAKTFDAYLDGKKVLSGYDWQKSAPRTPTVLSIVADFAAVDRQDAAVLHLDNVKVVTLP